MRACGPYDMAALPDMVRQLSSGMAWVHARQVLHLDLKTANMLRDSCGHCRIADFSNAVLVSDRFQPTLGKTTAAPVEEAPSQTSQGPGHERR